MSGTQENQDGEKALETEENRESSAETVYKNALDVYEQSRTGLMDAIHAMHKRGVYPPPPVAPRFAPRDERSGKVRRCKLGFGEDEIKFYIQSGEYSDGTMSDLFVTASKMGSLESGLLDSMSIIFSIGRQCGVPMDVIIEKLKSTRYDPSGMTGDKEFPNVTSITDYIVRWIESKYTFE